MKVSNQRQQILSFLKDKQGSPATTFKFIEADRAPNFFEITYWFEVFAPDNADYQSGVYGVVSDFGPLRMVDCYGSPIEKTAPISRALLIDLALAACEYNNAVCVTRSEDW